MQDLPAFLRDLPPDKHGEKPLPVETWNPPFCGHIDMRIARDGTWFYNGTPITRPAMVRLFSRVLRRDDDGFFLVTPVEKLGITVEDVPFLAVEMAQVDGTLTFRTNVDDLVTAGPDHPLRFAKGNDGFMPYVEVRRGLEARLTRALAQDLAALVEVRDDVFGVASGDLFFQITSDTF
ncbi:hypothetical protein ABI_46320 [Asticcacaulis biprosthecium C19]|uniref:DUF1285 domain-containing protein n=1 Tax=Asticcacaulis biprosthecium C19 TaxID=715226 RepID=F4QTY4_9CAUL|nr:DUF1285 domain-containing protein [Asticcacaulis biprosthecium]EGF89284.1 hypothetical protein ABI_46320 [Asticcacaulis biprosthecium C19]